MARGGAPIPIQRESCLKAAAGWVCVRVREWETESLRPSLPTVRPFLKWAGSKRALIHSLREYVGQPEPGKAYFEPFLGSGALFFASSPKKAVLSDVNWPLISAFRVVKSKTNALINHLEALPRVPTRNQYYVLRKRYNDIVTADANPSSETVVEIAALLIWLNHTCFNGLYRVNSSGRFNVPFGSRTERHIFSASNLKAASASLRSAQAELYAEPYEKVLGRAGRGDVVYIDPPYEPITDRGNFREYSASGFSAEDQARLADVVRELARKGCRVVISNSSARSIRELYEGFDFHEVLVNRMINCDGNARGPVQEVIIVGRQ